MPKKDKANSNARLRQDDRRAITRAVRDTNDAMHDTVEATRTLVSSMRGIVGLLSLLARTDEEEDT